MTKLATEITTLHSTAATANEAIIELNQRGRQLSAVICTKDDTIKRKDDTIERLQSEIESQSVP